MEETAKFLVNKKKTPIDSIFYQEPDGDYTGVDVEGNSLLEGTLSKHAQELSEEEQAQVLRNLGIDTKLEENVNLVKVTYEELVELRDNNLLVPGQQYRITDYITTTSQANTQSANHQFDIIVTADSENVLNENARAIQHEGDVYFANSNLSAWELKYCLDNDTNRFAWANTNNGKGVIYWMKDEFNNSCGYDFKNIQYRFFKYILDSAFTGNTEANSVTLTTDAINSLKNVEVGNNQSLPNWSGVINLSVNWRYTFNNFNGDLDLSLSSSCNNNTIEFYDDTPSYPSKLPIIVLTSDSIHHNKFESCCGSIYVQSSININHNIFNKRCVNLIIKNYGGFYDNILSSLQGSVIVCGQSYYNQFSGRNIMIFSNSHLKSNIFLAASVYAIKLHGTSFQHNVFYQCAYNINIFNGGYFLSSNIYQYSTAINIDTFNWIEKLHIRGSSNLTLLTTGTTYKLYNVDIMAGTYNSNEISITNGSNTRSLKVALKSNGNIVIYNEADLIADQN